MSETLKAEYRDVSTKSALKQLRKNGRIPGIVYGKDRKNSPIAISAKELYKLLRSHAHTVINMEFPDGSKEPVMISDLQYDTLDGSLLHVDFRKINMNQPVTTTVAVELTGEAPGVREGGIMQFQLHEVEIKCLPSQIPDSLKVDISHLGIGDNLYVSEIVPPEGVELRTDPNEVVVTIFPPEKEEEEPSAPAEETAEPVTD